MKRRFTAFIALVLLLFTSLPTAAEELHETDSGVVYTVENGEITVVGYHFAGFTLTVPAEIDGMPVTKVDKTAFYGDKNLTSVTLPDTVREIGEDAFSCCDNLTKVVLPKDLPEIPLRCFRLCKVLREVTMPETVRVIGPSAFEGCLMLESVVVPASVTEIGHDAFSGCGSLVLDCTDSPLGEQYAGENGLFTLRTAKSSPLPTILLLTAVLAAVLIAVELFLKKAGKKREK